MASSDDPIQQHTGGVPSFHRPFRSGSLMRIVTIAGRDTAAGAIVDEPTTLKADAEEHSTSKTATARSMIPVSQPRRPICTPTTRPTIDSVVSRSPPPECGIGAGRARKSPQREITHFALLHTPVHVAPQVLIRPHSHHSARRDTDLLDLGTKRSPQRALTSTHSSFHSETRSLFTAPHSHTPRTVGRTFDHAKNLSPSRAHSLISLLQ